MVISKDDKVRTKERLEADKDFLKRREATLGEAASTPKERKCVLQPARAFHAPLRPLRAVSE